nr:putative reverse transcriptase domain-containing protein [Tanacetum cinerariifolium]
KCKTFDWGEEQELAFQTLKDNLCNALVLALLNGPKDFMYGTKSVIYADHKSLQHIENVVADALSTKKRIKPKRVRAMNMVLHSSIEDRILTTQKEAVDELQDCRKGWPMKIESFDRWIWGTGSHGVLGEGFGDYVLLKVSPWKGVVRFGKKRKLAPRFVGLVEIVEKKCLVDPTLQVPLDEIRVDDKLNFVEAPMEILEREFKKLKRSRIAIVKVRWNSKCGPEFMWEREDKMKLKYPRLFSIVSS